MRRDAKVYAAATPSRKGFVSVFNGLLHESGCEEALPSSQEAVPMPCRRKGPLTTRSCALADRVTTERPFPAPRPGVRPVAAAILTRAIPKGEDECGGGHRGPGEGELSVTDRLGLRRQVLFACLGVALGFTAVEVKFPYAFCQDDNRSYSLPLWVHATRAASFGEIAEYNLHQALGTANLATGQPAALYPATIACVWASEAFWGHPFAAVDIFAALHLLLAALGGLYLGRALKLGGLASVFLAISWGLNPACFYFGRSWIHVVVAMAALPWMVGALVFLMRRPSRRHMAVLVAAHVGFFLVGHANLFALSVIFESEVVVFAAMARASRREPQQIVPTLLASAFLVATLSLPLLLPMLNQVGRSSERSGALPYRVFAGQALPIGVLANGLLAPWSRLARDTHAAPFLELGAPPGATHLGYLPLVCILAPLVVGIRRRSSLRRWWIAFVAAAAVSLAWALGLLLPIIYHVPLLNRFRWPFKLDFFFGFGFVVASSIGLSMLVRKAGPSRKWLGVLAAAVLIHGLNLVWADQAGRNQGVSPHADSLPLKAEVEFDWHGGRVATFGFDAKIGVAMPTAPGIGFSYASLWNCWHFGSYDPLTSDLNRKATLGRNYTASFHRVPNANLVAYLRAWSVRWYIVDPRAVARATDPLLASGLRVIERTPERWVFEDPQALPLVETLNAGCRALRASATCNSLTVPLRCPDGGRVRIGVLRTPGLEAWVGERSVPLLADDLGRAVVGVPPGTQQVRLLYRAPYFRSGCLLSALLLAGAALFLWLRRFG